MFSAFAKALAQFGDPAFRRPLVTGLAVTAVLFAGLWTAIWFVLAHTRLSDVGWIEVAVDSLGGLATVILTFLLFPGIAAAVMSLFVDGIIAAVEARHYPHLPPPRHPSLGEQIGLAGRFGAAAVALNLIALPFYLIPVVNVLVFYGVNSYLLAREYYEMAAPRRLGAGPRRTLWRQRRPVFILAGVVIAFVSTLPLVNLAAPVLAAAAMTHLVERYRQSAPRTGQAHEARS
ncbi:MAG TPA: EI24 domain-containing protein [Alphaproteobacteria bacterium]